MMTEEHAKSDGEGESVDLGFEHVTIGILTALEEEYAACRRVFDPDRKGIQQHARNTSGAVTCWICTVPAKHGGTHTVAISMLPDMGNTAAAIVASTLLERCPRIEDLIMCGIAGAVPDTRKADNHVRLGDIVVTDSSGIVQYDRGKQRDSHATSSRARADNLVCDPFAGFEFRNAPRVPSARLLHAVKLIHSDETLLARHALRPWDHKIKRFLRCSDDQESWKRPYHNKDQLNDSPNGKGQNARHPKDGMRRTGHPRVFHGPIAAANIVLADPQKRDALRDRFGIRAVEMEGSGVADASWVAEVGYLVVRGTCDYCNSTKNDNYHYYAALIAASYACTVIEYLHPSDQAQPSSEVPPTRTHALAGEAHRSHFEFGDVNNVTRDRAAQMAPKSRGTHEAGRDNTSHAEKYDVFFSYNSTDRKAVVSIAKKLLKRKLRPWVDDWDLVPGTSWQDALAAQLGQIGAMAVFMGPGGLGPWQSNEIKAFLNQSANRDCIIIPVILPGYDERIELPLFLQTIQCVDFRVSERIGLDDLVWAVTGRRPVTRDPILGDSDIGADHPIHLPAHACQVPSIDSVGDLVKKIEMLREEYRRDEVASNAKELERRLRALPRRGNEVRKGWLELARVERQNLRAKQQAGEVIDKRRLSELRQEAENVVD